jgi:hypothetical protein
MWNLQLLMKRMLLWNLMDRKLLEDGSRLIQTQEHQHLAQEAMVVVVVAVVGVAVVVVEVAVAVVAVAAVVAEEEVVGVGHPDQGYQLMQMHQALESIRR